MSSTQNVFWSILIALILGVPGVLSAHSAGQSFPVSPPLDPADAEIRWRWIGIKANGLPYCPEPAPPSQPSPPSPRWTTRELFPRGVSDGLEMFCLYETTRAGTPTTPFSDLTDLVTNGFLVDVRPDRMVVFSLATDLRGALWPTLQDHFVAHAGKVALPLHAEAPKVRLSLIDTSPTSGMNPTRLPESSPHGMSLKLFAEDLLCDSTKTRCVAEVFTRLALAYKDFDRDALIHRDEVVGGYFGTVSELAQAIVLEVKAAKEEPDQRHVINLSVAWDGIFGGFESDVSQMPPDVQAVYNAIRGATCEGAIVIAAAGNSNDRLGASAGSLYPAAWAHRTISPEGPCSNPTELSGSKLLYSVAGVQADGTPLGNARPRSASRFAAYGDHAVIKLPQGQNPTAVLTGSSVAALVASATAAGGVYYRPRLSTEDLMEAIYSSGKILGRKAEVCEGGPPCKLVSYMSLCETVAEVCESDDGFCPASPPVCQPRPFQRPTFPTGNFDDFYDPSNPTVTWVPGGRIVHPFPPTGICGSEEPFFQAPYQPTDPCPQRQYYDLNRTQWSSPQPGTYPCPICTFTPGGLLIEIEPSFSGALSNPTLIACGNTNNPIALSLNSSAPLVPGSAVLVTGLPASLANCNSLQLSFTVTSNGNTNSTTGALLIGQ